MNPSARPYRFTFVLDQQVGLKTFALNLEAVARTDAEIAPTFVPVCYQAPAGLISRLPGVPQSIKGTLRGVGEIRALVDPEASDAIFWQTWAAKSVPDLICAAPSFLSMDMTPLQMEEMGHLYGYSRARSRFGGQWKKQATQKLYQNVRHLFVWSNWAAQSLKTDYGVSPEKITVVSPGVDVGLYRPGRADEKPGDGITRLLFVGGDFVRKGGDLLLRWANETKTTVPWEIHIVTRDVVPETKNVHIYHNVANNSDVLLGLYRKCDGFVLPTRADCYSLVGMEAQASGLPVIISDLAGIPDVVSHNETGFLVPPDNYEVLADALDRMVENAGERTQMARNARVRAREKFDCRVNLGRILWAMKAACDAK